MAARIGPSSQTLVFFHGPWCLDGLVCAWVCHTALLGGGAGRAAVRFVPVKADVGSSSHLKQLLESPSSWVYGDVFFVDTSPSPEHLALLLGRGCRVVVLDHHSSAARAHRSGLLEGAEVSIDTSLCGADVVWRHFFGSAPVPWFMDVVRFHDTWTFRKHSHPFHMRQTAWHIEHRLLSQTPPPEFRVAHSSSFNRWLEGRFELLSLWSSTPELFWGLVSPESWRLYVAYMDEVSAICDQVQRVPTKAGDAIMMVNDPRLHCASDVYDMLDGGGSMLLMWRWQRGGSGGRDVIASVRGPGAQEFAEKLGGGGHVEAAGFRCAFSALADHLDLCGGDQR